MKKKLWSIVSIALLFVGVICFLKANAEDGQVLTGTYRDTVTWEFDTATGAMTISGTGFFSTTSIWDQIEKSQVTSVTIEEGVSEIGRNSFSDCTNLSYVVLPNTITSMPEGLFEGCSSLSSIVLPEGLDNIGHSAFMGCGNLSNIDIPESVTFIDAYAFYNCSSLDAVSIPEGVTIIRDYAFFNCKSLNDVSIPESVTSIGEYAFAGCDKLNNIDILNGLTNIGNYAFSSCSSMTSIRIPESVTSIGNGAFYGCSILTGIWVDENNINYCNDEQGVLFNKGKTEIFWVPQTICGDYIIPDGINTIKQGDFSGCDRLTSVSIPESVTSIGNGVFSGCSSLTGIWVNENNANYSSDASGVLFNKDKTEFVCVPPAICGEYVIPETITAINWGTFTNCTKLSSMVIPAGVKTISDSFLNVPLNGIWVDENNANYSSDSRGVLFNKDKTSLLCAPIAISGEYEIPKGVTTIATHAFAGCRDLNAVIIPEGVINIEDTAFSYCTSLTSIVIPEGITIIPYYAFMDCKSLSSVILPNSLTEIWAEAFSGCTNLSSIEIPNNVTLIGSGAFIGCNLSEVTIPASVTTIGYAAFSYLPNLKEIKFEGDAPTINAKAFGETTPTVATVYYPAMNETWNAETMLNYGGDLTWVPYYDVLEDSDLTWNDLEGGDISISICAPYEEFICVQIDGNELTNDQYSVTEGENGTVVTVYEEYLMSLDEKNVKQTKMRSLLLTENNELAHNMVVIFEKGTATINLHLEFIEEPEYLPGDINNDGMVNNRDLTRLFQYLSYWEVEVNEAALDVNGDGSVNNRDLTRLFQYLSNWDVEIH